MVILCSFRSADSLFPCSFFLLENPDLFSAASIADTQPSQMFLSECKFSNPFWKAFIPKTVKNIQLAQFICLATVHFTNHSSPGSGLVRQVTEELLGHVRILRWKTLQIFLLHTEKLPAYETRIGIPLV